MKLNQQQQQAVEHGEGPLIIIAGAGTGKTTVIAERFLYILQKFHLQTENILCLTFTEKGAAEMEERIESRLQRSHSPLWIHTFHGFADRILKMYGHEIGISKKLKLLSGGERFIFMRDHLHDFDLEYYKPIANPTSSVHDLLNFFDHCKTENIAPEQYLHHLNVKEKQLESKRYEYIGDEYEAEKELIAKQREAVRAYAKYNELLRQYEAWDYGDMVYFLYQLLSERKSVLQELKKQFRFVLVDEYQDTNGIQNAIIKLLVSQSMENIDRASSPCNLTVVGDDDQSIFRFQGASVQNILQFVVDFPNAKEIVLTENYRSSQNILDAAYALIQHNNPYRLEIRQSIDKKLKSNQFDWNDKLEIIQSETHLDEVDSIIQSISSLVDGSKNADSYNYSDMAILYRSHAHAEAIIEGLKSAQIPYQVVEGSGLFRRREVRDLFACLRAFANPDDSISLFRMLSLEWFSIDPIILLRMSNFAKKNNISLMEVLEQHIDDIIHTEHIGQEGTLFADFSHPDKDALQSFRDFFHECARLQFTLSASQFIQHVLEASSWLETLNQEKNLSDVQKRANLIKIIRKAQRFEYEHEQIFVQQFVDYIDALIEGGENPEQAHIESADNAVTLMTIHKSKGLEWPIVFTIQMAARKFPSDNRRPPIPIAPELLGENLPDSDAHIQEERRLFYVALTRAKRKLYLTYATNYGGSRAVKPSRFIEELASSPELQAIIEKKEFISDDTNLASNRKISQSTEIPVSLSVEPGFRLPVVNRNFHLNYSSISAFRDCPLKFKYLNIIQIPRPQVAAPQFGSMIHAALENFYRSIREDQVVSESTLLDFYRDAWKSYGFIDKEQEKQYFEKGLEMLSQFWQDNQHQLSKPIFIEKGFRLKVGSHNVSGFIDRIDRIGSDEVEVIDYKTGRPKTEKDIKRDQMARLQLYIYAIACQDLFNMNATRLSLYYLDNGTKVTLFPEPEDLAWAQNIIEETGLAILDSDFSGTPGRVCQWCDFRNICPSRAKE